jgi:hypothetical protein
MALGCVALGLAPGLAVSRLELVAASLPGAGWLGGMP